MRVPLVAFVRKRLGPWRLGLLAALLVAAAEIYLRLAYSEQLALGVYPLIYEPDAHLGYRYRPKAASRIRVPSIDKEVRIGPHGFYGPALALEKPAGTVRIAVVGSSNATGIWLDGERPFSRILQELYEDAGQPVEVLNLAIDGAYHELANVRIAETRALEFAPDVVLLSAKTQIMDGVLFRESYRGYVFEPGHSDHSEAELEHARLAAHRFIERVEGCSLTKLYDVSYVFRALHRRAWTPTDLRLEDVEAGRLGDLLEAYRRKRVDIAYPRALLSAHHTLTRIREAADRLERAGAQLIVFQYGADPEEVDAFRRYGLTCWSLDMPTGSALLHEHDGHYNQRGHELIAHRLHALLGSTAVLIPRAGSGGAESGSNPAEVARPR